MISENFTKLFKGSKKKKEEVIPSNFWDKDVSIYIAYISKYIEHKLNSINKPNFTEETRVFYFTQKTKEFKEAAQEIVEKYYKNIKIKYKNESLLKNKNDKFVDYFDRALYDFVTSENADAILYDESDEPSIITELIIRQIIENKAVDSKLNRINRLEELNSGREFDLYSCLRSFITGNGPNELKLNANIEYHDKNKNLIETRVVPSKNFSTNLARVLYIEYRQLNNEKDLSTLHRYLIKKLIIDGESEFNKHKTDIIDEYINEIKKMLKLFDEKFEGSLNLEPETTLSGAFERISKTPTKINSKIFMVFEELAKKYRIKDGKTIDRILREVMYGN